MNLPNCLSLLRILLIPFFIILLFRGNYPEALILLVLGGLTDFLDGVLARALNQITKLGSYLDPIGDKLFLISSFIALTIIRSPNGDRLIPLWLTAIIFSRELIILIGTLLVLSFTEKPVFSVVLTSKTATFFQAFVVCFTVLSRAFPELSFVVFKIDILKLFIWLAAIFTIISGFQYIHREIETLISRKGRE